MRRKFYNHLDKKKITFFVICLVFTLLGMEKVPVPQQGNVVTIIGRKGNWQLLVNRKPFELKGVGVGQINGKEEKADYLHLAKEMGANAVRTWGISQGTKEYLDKAYKYGLLVDAGIWLDPVLPEMKHPISYQGNSSYKKAIRDEVLSYVRRFKDHPAILFWNVGNEVLYWTKDEDERIAFCRFLEALIQEIHTIDPNHPIIYTTSMTTAVSYIKKYVPSLDILGVNAYGNFEGLHKDIIRSLGMPYIITEFGHAWTTQGDINGRLYEPREEEKALDYKRFAYQIKKHKGYCLGMFAFYLGDTTQISYTWWNLTYGFKKKLPYLVMKSIYTGRPIKKYPPIIKRMSIRKKILLHPNEVFYIQVELRHANEKDFKFQYFASTAKDEFYFSEYPNTKIPFDVMGKGPKVAAKAPSKPGTYRVYVVVSNDDLATVANKTIQVIE